MKAVGICLGASSISYVEILEKYGKIEIKNCFNRSHNGNPKQSFESIIESINEDNIPVIVTGRKFRKIVNFNTISEPEATEIAFSFINSNKTDFSAIASLGGETFIVYNLDINGKIASINSKNQCASGTGEFYLQQIKRMNLSLKDSIEISKGAEPFRVSGRCSVFCKSDCTHALNKGTPKETVTAGLSQMIADKIIELLGDDYEKNILLVGGVTQNDVVVDFIRRKFKNITIPNESNYFEALGAAIYGLKKGGKCKKDVPYYFNSRKSSFSFHKPLIDCRDKVTFKTLVISKPLTNEKCILGLDVGSTTTKAVIISADDSRLLASVYLYTNGNPIKAAQDCYKMLIDEVGGDINIIGLGTTGSGRQITGIHAVTEGIVNEIVAHATAAVFFDPEVDTIFEIGGQDAKYTYIVNRIPADYAMNEACSAGTGSFIEESAYESLGVKVQDIEKIAFSSNNPPNFSDQCAAFISSDIKTALQENIEKNDIIAGLVYSVCLNYVNRVKGNRKVGNKIFMQGGVCYNKAIPVAMAALTNSEIVVPPEPGLMGAYGVALVIRERLNLGIIDEQSYNLTELAQREVVYKKPFICLGGKEKCDLKCNVNIIEVVGKKYPFGGACNKYYNIKQEQKFDSDEFDYVKKRQQLLFKDLNISANTNRKKIGFNLSFLTYSLFPLFYNFFNSLGFDIVLSDENDADGLKNELTSFCYPAEISLGMFQNLIKKNPDYYFLPKIYEMEVEHEKEQRLDFNCTCVFVSGEPIYLKQAFKKQFNENRILSPNLNFANGYASQFEQFADTAMKLGIKDLELIENAFKNAVEKQREFQSDLYLLGKEALSKVNENNNFGIIVIGRPYNAFAKEANKGIPQKFASRGIYTIPYDIIDFGNDFEFKNMYWESGKRILKAAEFVSSQKNLFPVYISNYSCGPDSMILTTFREIMGEKPSLTLELDGHTADAGINTRIDAAIDIIGNYLKLKSGPESINTDFKAAQVIMGREESKFVTSDGDILNLRDNSVKLLIPSMGDTNSEMFAAALRSLGFNCEALPPSNPETVKLGRSVASGKECLPVILLAGALLEYINKNKNNQENIALFNVQGAGNCRLGQYPVFLNHVIKSKKLHNVAQATLQNEDGFAGFGQEFAKRGIQAIIIGDVLDDIRSAILANSVNPADGEHVFNIEFERLKLAMEYEPDAIYDALDYFAHNIRRKIPAKRNINNSNYIALLGEIFVRRDLFAHKWLNKYFAEKGFILKIAYISEWILYVDYLIKHNYLEPEKSVKKKLEREFRSYFMRITERKIKKILEKTGYYKYTKTDIKKILMHSRHIIPLEFKGEPGLTLGTALSESFEKYCGIINLGPFGCMPTRFTEAVTVPEMNLLNKTDIKQHPELEYKFNGSYNGIANIPFLTLEVDGNALPQVIEAKLETFLLQAQRVADLIKNNKVSIQNS